MNIIINLLIFCLVLFIYLHIYFHYKTSNDLEVYEIEQPSKDKLEEICDLRQPVVFDFNNNNLSDNCNLNTIIDSYGAFDVKLRNVKDNDDESELYLPLSLVKAKKVLEDDDEEKYILESNNEFIEETGIIKHFRYNDDFLRPHMVSNCLYDLMSGSLNTTTPLKYELNYRNYYYVTHGKVTIKLAPPKSKKYLYPISDYYNFEFKSPVDPWNIQQQYKADFDKIKCLEVTLHPGQIIYIPAFWWYSIKFVEKNTTLCTFKYRTYMNSVGISPYIFMKILQNQNVKREIVKKMKINNEK